MHCVAHLRLDALGFANEEVIIQVDVTALLLFPVKVDKGTGNVLDAVVEVEEAVVRLAHALVDGVVALQVAKRLRGEITAHAVRVVLDVLLGSEIGHIVDEGAVSNAASLCAVRYVPWSLRQKTGRGVVKVTGDVVTITTEAVLGVKDG